MQVVVYKRSSVKRKEEKKIRWEKKGFGRNETTLGRPYGFFTSLIIPTFAL